MQRNHYHAFVISESGGGSLLSSLASLPRRVRAKLPGSKAKKEKKHHWMSPEGFIYIILYYTSDQQ